MAPRKIKRVPKTVDEETFKKIISEVLKPNNPNRFSIYEEFARRRDATGFYLMWSMGLRPSEARLIRIEDIDFKNKRVLIKGENNKQRQEDWMPIPTHIYDFIIKYLKTRNYLFGTSRWLFPSKEGVVGDSRWMCVFRNALKDSGLYQVAYKDKLGLNRSTLTLYSLRHSFGTRVYDKTHDLLKTALVLRHHDMKCRSTMVYIHTTQDKSRMDVLREIYPEENKDSEMGAGVENERNEIL